MNVLVTGAGGFIGRVLCPALVGHGHTVTRILRSGSRNERSHYRATGVIFAEIDSTTDWSEKFVGTEVIVHLAAMVHVMQPKAEAMLEAFREVNVEGSVRLVEAAAAAGVRRVIYLSSIKVNGEETFGQPFAADHAPAPVDAYAMSKCEAEQRLREVEADTGIEIVVIRPPLVYGPGVKGNLRRLADALERGWPMPFGAIRNRRDMVSVYNLCDLICTCVDHPRAAGQTLLVSDGEALSTRQLVRRLAAARGIDPRILSIPVGLLRLFGLLTGSHDQVNRLTGSLEIDSEPTRELLDWSPPDSVEESFARIFADA